MIRADRDSHGLSSLTVCLLLAACFCILALTKAPAPAQAALPELREFCPTGSGGGQCLGPRGVAVDPASGDIYVVSQANSRVDKFTAWGQFLRAWGWDVVASGPGDSGEGFEICSVEAGDVCKQGLKGAGRGQFDEVQGIAVDSEGSVHVADWDNLRVQKFDSEGHFVLMFGGAVNKTKVEALAPEAEQNVCPIAPTDVCQAGTAGTGNGQFESWPLGSFIAADAQPIGTIYVGDKDRIQEFDTSGNYEGEIALPESGQVDSLAFDPSSSDLYFSYTSPINPVTGTTFQPNVHRLDAGTGSEVGDPLAVGIPTAIAVSSSGRVFVFDQKALGNSAEPGNHIIRVLEFDSSGNQIGIADQNESPSVENRFNGSTGMATSSACNIPGADLILANINANNSFVRIYGPPPDIDVCRPPEVPPTITSQHALSVGVSGATVRAEINPHFWSDTSYYVEYGLGECSKGGCDKTALFPGSQLGAGVVDRLVLTKGVFLGADQALLADTTYHYRFVAESEGGGPAFGVDPDGSGPEEPTSGAGIEGTFHTFAVPAEPKACPGNQQYRTGASARLPDCRAYEMVSPLDKNNSDVSAAVEAHDMSAADGNSLTYTTLAAAYANPVGAPFASQYMSVRDEDAGWGTQSISPPRKLPPLYRASETFESLYKGFSEDLCSGWVLQDTDVALAPGAPAGVPNLYRRDNCGPGSGTYELITSVAPTQPAPGFSVATEPESKYYLDHQGSSADGSVSVFRAPAMLTPDASTKDLFQVYAAKEGTLHAVSILPNGNPASFHSSVGTAQGPKLEFKRDSVYRAVSEDGSRIFWTASEDNEASREPGAGHCVADVSCQQGKLYVRLNATQAPTANGKCTVGEEGKACTVAIASGRFVTAAADGSVALYTIGEELREFDVTSKTSTPIAAGVKGVLGASEDAQRVHFVSTEALDDGASEGAPNLYFHERGQGTAFVATLAALDALNTEGVPSPGNDLPRRRTARVSPDGLHVAFMATGSLTGYDSTDANGNQPDAEVYLYDAPASGDEGSLVCVSCNPTGARPSGRPLASTNGGKLVLWAAARLPGWISQNHPGNLLSADGNRLFFESFEALVPRDTNGKQDVYEWTRAASEEDCEERVGGEIFVAASGGCLSLISSGESAEDSELIDASADGSDVFFATQSSLLVQDYGLRDIYDARAGGGFPPPPVAAPGCEGEACQPPSSAPEDITPASSSFQGAGNVSQAQPPRRRACPKRKVRRKGRCVPRQRSQRRQRANRERRAGR